MAKPDEALFAQQLGWVRQTWDIVSQEDFAKMIDGKLPVKYDSLLLSFDDGTISNLHVAEHILKPLGI